MEVKTYWEHEDFASPYQMGPQKHRIYILDKLRDLEVGTLLDVGCGTGPIYELLINQDDTHAPWDNIITYKGIDYSWRMIETCKKLFPYGEFEVQDARNMKETNNSWDCVLLMHCLDHLDDYQSVIKEAVRVSKKYIAIILWSGFVNEGTRLNSRSDLNLPKDEQGNLLPGYKPWEDTHFQQYSKEVLIKEFDKYNLEDVDIAEVPDPYSKWNFIWILKKP